MLADAEDIEPRLIGQLGGGDDLGIALPHRDRATGLRIICDIAEGIETQFHRLTPRPWRTRQCSSGKLLGPWWRRKSASGLMLSQEPPGRGVRGKSLNRHHPNSRHLRVGLRFSKKKKRIFLRSIPASSACYTG